LCGGVLGRHDHACNSRLKQPPDRTRKIDNDIPCRPTSAEPHAAQDRGISFG
jgi:hypothetical protein